MSHKEGIAANHEIEAYVSQRIESLGEKMEKILRQAKVTHGDTSSLWADFNNYNANVEELKKLLTWMRREA